MVDVHAHWSAVWSERTADAVTWAQEHPTTSLDLLTSVTPDLESAVIDIGGGASTLVDHLLALGYRDVTVLDVAEAALRQAQDRLGRRAEAVRWVSADIVTHRFDRSYEVWHDRAVFHFLTDPDDRARYVAQAARAVQPDGHLIIATFAEDGPEMCSGLAVERYSAASLAAQFAPTFAAVKETDEWHRTPTGDRQHFVYLVLRRAAR